MEPRRSKLRKDNIYGPKQEVYRKIKEEIHFICGKVNYCPAAEDKINDQTAVDQETALRWTGMVVEKVVRSGSAVE